jgi:hypothetical protein
VGQLGVVVVAGVAGWVDVHGGARETRDVMGELVFGVGGDFVGGEQGEVGSRFRQAVSV